MMRAACKGHAGAPVPHEGRRRPETLGVVMANGTNASMDRRGFLKAAGATGVAALAAGSLAAAAQAAEADTQAWDEECDILVVGYGGAGAASAITAAEEDLGDVLVIEAAPEGDEGGNTRVCGQIIFCPRSVEGAIEYQGNLNAQYKVADDLMQAWAEEITKNAEWLTSIGANPVETPIASPEFPDIAGAKASCNYVVDGTMGSQSLWNVLKGKESELGIHVSYGTRAVRLVEEAGEVHGVVAERDGVDVAIKGKKGVILACGGFENDPDMLSNYHPLGMDGEHVIPLGTPYNRGDGVRMAQRVGAGLWHMNNFSRGGWAMPALCDRSDEFARCGSFPAYASKDYIYVGPNAKRWAYEEATGLTRHGKTEVHGVYMDQQVPEPGYVIVGSKCFDGGRIIAPLPYLAAWSMEKVDADGTNESDLEKGRIVKGETAAELAEKLGLDPDALTATIDEYNEGAAKNEDPLFGRGQNYYSSNQDMTGRDNDSSPRARTPRRHLPWTRSTSCRLNRRFTASRWTSASLTRRVAPRAARRARSRTWTAIPSRACSPQASWAASTATCTTVVATWARPWPPAASPFAAPRSLLLGSNVLRAWVDRAGRMSWRPAPGVFCAEGRFASQYCEFSPLGVLACGAGGASCCRATRSCPTKPQVARLAL